MDWKRVGEAVVVVDHLDEVGEVVDLVEDHGEVEDAVCSPREEAVPTHVVVEYCYKLLHV